MSEDTITLGWRTYRVERRHSPTMPYVLHGPRGAMYGLVRSRTDPRLLFPVSGRTLRTPPSGWPLRSVWMTDSGGRLRPEGAP